MGRPYMKWVRNMSPMWEFEPRPQQQSSLEATCPRMSWTTHDKHTNSQLFYKMLDDKRKKIHSDLNKIVIPLMMNKNKRN